MNKFLLCLIPAIMMFLSGCIHEYPHGNAGENPNALNVGLELELQLQWIQRAVEVEMGSKSSSSLHRIIIEASKDGKAAGRDIICLSDEQFANGEIRHTLSFRMLPAQYDIVVWTDCVSPDRDNLFYDPSSLSEISMISSPVVWEKEMQCGYACQTIDLRQYDSKSTSAKETIKVENAGSRFELVATDITDFLEAQDYKIQHGETYTIELNFSSPYFTTFNAITGGVGKQINNFSTEGELWLPFGLYDSLTIAEGILFTPEEGQTVEMAITVFDSAKMPVVRTPYFSFDVNRGYLTRVFGKFMSEEFSAGFQIDNIWAGEVIIDL